VLQILQKARIGLLMTLERTLMILITQEIMTMMMISQKMKRMTAEIVIIPIHRQRNGME
jgi:hypothetical protein